MNPLRQALIANTVPKKDLMNAIALRSLGFNVTRMIGPAIGGILIETQGLHINLIIQGVACILGMLLLMPLKMPFKEISPPNKAFMTDFLQGIKYLVDQPVLFRLLIMTLASTAFILPLKSMMPVVAAIMFDGDAITAGFLTSSLGVGALIGSLAIAQSSKLKRKFIMALLCLILSGCMMILFAQSRWLPVSVSLGILFGLSHMIFGLINNTLVQSLVPDHLRGRISSIYMAETGVVPAGILLLGWLMASIGPAIAVSILGIGTIMVSLLIIRLKKIDQHDEI
jgi:MFS family permease